MADVRTDSHPPVPDPQIRPSRDIGRLIGIWRRCAIRSRAVRGTSNSPFATIAPFTLEEAYEVADAIERGDTEDLREELGDLLLQVVFHARMAEEAGRSISAASSRRSRRS